MYISFLYGFRTSSPLSGPETIGGFRIFTTQVVRKLPGCLSYYPHMYGYTPFLYGFCISSPLSGPETVSGFRLFTTQVVGKPLHRCILSGYTPFLYGFCISSPLSGPETVSGFRLFTIQVVGKPLTCIIHIIPLGFPHFVTAKWSGNHQWFPHLYCPGGWETTMFVAYYPYIRFTHSSCHLFYFVFYLCLITLLVIYFILCFSYV